VAREHFLQLTMVVHSKHGEILLMSHPGASAQEFGEFSLPVVTVFHHYSVELLTGRINLVQELFSECTIV